MNDPLEVSASATLRVQVIRRRAFGVVHPLLIRIVCLPSLGVDGTLAKSVDPDSPARDKVWAKTGTLSWDNVMNDKTLLANDVIAGHVLQAGKYQ